MDEFRIKVRGESLVCSKSESGHAKGVFVFAHGLGEHMGRYAELFSRMNAIGMTCLGADHIGHGHSPGKRGHAPDYEFFMTEIGALISYARENYNGLPLFLYGHSMGGNIGLHYIIDHPDEISGAVITSPWISLQARVSPAKKFLSKVAAGLLPSLTVSNELDPSGISSDPEEVKRYVEDPLIHDRISTSLFQEVSGAAARIEARAGSISVPVLLMHGTADPITSHEGSAGVAEKNDKYITFKLFPGSRHELHHDRSRESVFLTVEKWLSELL